MAKFQHDEFCRTDCCQSYLHMHATLQDILRGHGLTEAAPYTRYPTVCFHIGLSVNRGITGCGIAGKGRSGDCY